MPSAKAALKPGQTVILDNLGAQLLYLSSDFNPIEQAFAKLKVLLRFAAARTVTELRDAIPQDFGAFTIDKCRNYLNAAGYDAFDPM